MALHRWRFVDPADTDPATNSYAFPINPNQMSSPFPEKNITSEGTTSATGQAIIWQGMDRPVQWTFGGAILNKAHHEKLREWVYERSGRLYVFDHFGRRLTVVLTKFAPEPKRSVGRYWRHTYTINGLVLAITEPTVPESGGMP